MTNITLSNAQQRVLEDAANFPDSEIEKFTQHLPVSARPALMNALLKKGCIEPRGDKHFITAAGCNAVGRDATPCNAPKPQSKQSQMLALLSREEGATLADLQKVTGWQAHSIRGHISNMRKKQQLPIEVSLNGEGKRVYQIAQEADAA